MNGNLLKDIVQNQIVKLGNFCFTLAIFTEGICFVKIFSIYQAEIKSTSSFEIRHNKVFESINRCLSFNFLDPKRSWVLP